MTFLKLKNAGAKKLPARVIATINEQENSSEILIKIVQIMVFGIWGILYLIPKPQTVASTGMSLVPYVLVLYLVLNIIGLIWAMRRTLPHWALYFNILIDMSMLMVLIWSFHIQYDQPPSFYLKAPTAMYIFIFIALRALRFQARFVITAGAIAILGWMVLTGYVIFSDPENNMITRDFVEYMTSNSVLIGAEMDKILTITFVTAILALVISRARKLLVQAVTESAAVSDMSRFFDQSVAEKIRSSENIIKPGEGVRRQAAILNIDIRGFTPLGASMQPSQTVCLLTSYQQKLLPIIQKHGGVIDKFLGDGIMASFGAVADSDTYAADALRSVDDIIAETDRWFDDDELKIIAGSKINCAVASGNVVFGVLGGADRLEYTTIGDAVNRSAKLEKCNKEVATRAITDQQTLQLAISQGYVKSANFACENQFVESIGEKVELVYLKRL